MIFFAVEECPQPSTPPTSEPCSEAASPASGTVNSPSAMNMSPMAEAPGGPRSKGGQCNYVT